MFIIHYVHLIYGIYFHTLSSNYLRITVNIYSIIYVTIRVFIFVILKYTLNYRNLYKLNRHYTIMSIDIYFLDMLLGILIRFVIYYLTSGEIIY